MTDATAAPATPATIDNPEAYIARDRRRALADGLELPDRVQGSGIFADISGFTPLTEALRNELGPQRGAEELTANLDRAFHAVIAELDRYGGNVIYFSGDAITGWLDGDDGRRAVAAAIGMQAAMDRVGRVVTPGGTEVRLAMKVSIAVGPARRFVVGDPDVQYIDVLAGHLVDALADAEHAAEKGEIVLDASAVAALGKAVTIAEERSDPETGHTVAVVGGLAVEVPEAPEAEPRRPLDPAIVRHWLLPDVFERLTAGRGEFLADLRPAYPVFLRFGGIDFDTDDAADEKLNEFVVRAERIFESYGGNVLQLTLGDKGAYLYGVFGSPVAHEDDAVRAATAALELATLDHDTAARDIQIGIAYGQLRSGTYGHAMRRTFVCLGDAVNLAARLMGSAPAGRIYVSDEVRRAAGEGFVWETIEPLRLKGKADPVAVHVLSSSLALASRRQVRFELPIVGREAELTTLDEALVAANEGHGGVIGLAAEAGLGKSRLVAEFVRSARRRGILVAFGECQSYGRNTSYFVWREIWRRLLDVDDEASPEAQRAAVERAVAAIDPGLIERAPLAGDVIGLSMADSELTRAFDAKLRKASGEDLLATILSRRTEAEPIVLVLEDCHWIDGPSRDLLEALARATPARRILFVLAYRPAGEPGGGLGLGRLPHFRELPLDQLGPGETRSVIAAKASQLFGADVTAPESLVETVVERAGGNPFYAEELLNFVANQGILLSDADAIARLELPGSLHTLVLSRIDALAEDPRRAIKIASVIGRLFRAPMLPGVYPELGTLDEILPRLDVLRAQDLVTLDQAETLSYLFRHVVTQEVAYESLPFAIRAGLHRRVGGYIEETEAADLEPHLDLLAHHYTRGDDEAKKREFIRRAADSARRRYANDIAIGYYERLAEMLDGAERATALLDLGKVLEVTGAWTRAEEVETQALGLAREVGDGALVGRAEAALAEVARKQGRYDEASRRLASAADEFRAVDDDEGLGLVLHLAGTVAAQRGDLDEARRSYLASLEIRERVGDRTATAALHSNLGIVAEYAGDYPAARDAHGRALAIRSELGDRWALGNSYNNLGMIALHEEQYAEARDSFEEGIAANREVGDAWMVAIGQNNLGNAHRGLGNLDEAREHYLAALETYRRFDDQWALAFLLEDVAQLVAASGATREAFELLGAADAMREAIGSPRGAALDEDITTRLASARDVIGARAASAARRRGARRPVADSLDLADSRLRG